MATTAPHDTAPHDTAPHTHDASPHGSQQGDAGHDHATPLGGRRFSAGGSCATGSAWPKHRVLFLLAGTFTVTGTALAAGVNPWFALLPGLVGLNQLLLVATGWCPASAVLDRVLPSAQS